jgi:hypothetical protein
VNKLYRVSVVDRAEVEPPPPAVDVRDVKIGKDVKQLIKVGLALPSEPGGWRAVCGAIDCGAG